MKPLLRAGMSLFALLVTALITAAQTTPPDLSGTWAPKSGPIPDNVETVQITQSGSQVQVTEKHETKAKKPDRVLTFYTDARGESNLTSDGKTYLRSRTKWIGDTLFSQFDDLSKPPYGVNGRYDEWTLSKDGVTLTITTTFTTKGPHSMQRSVFGTARSDSTFETTRKRVFKKVN
jgi:hypothetical protein